MKNLLFLFLAITVSAINAQKISVKGNWSKTLKVSDIENAGADYKEMYLSKKNQTKISVNPIPNNWYNRLYMPFKVYVQKEDYNWNPNLVLEVKVSSSIHGNNSGTHFQEITNYPTQFFNFHGRKKNIPIQYRIKGLSVTLPADNYSTEIIYTVLNL